MNIIDKLSKHFNIIFKYDGADILLKDGVIVFELQFDSCDEFQDVLINECNHHLQMINSKDNHYFMDCDEDYLNGEWKELVEKIKKIAK